MPQTAHSLSPETTESYIQRLTHYLTISQLSMNHVSKHLNMAEAEPLHSQAVRIWTQHKLYHIPPLHSVEKRQQWFHEIDIICTQAPASHDYLKWIIRVFACHGAVEAIHMQELLHMPNRALAAINVEVGRRQYKNVTGKDQPPFGPQTSRDKEMAANHDLIGHIVVRPNGYGEVEQLTVVDYVTGLVGRAFFILQNVAPDEDGKMEHIMEEKLRKLQLLPEEDG
ncbi:uncharacterized protein LAESUDRAFT_723873 [Laetiporus sulphureus 93-53]|uniref:Uncharacterized protein n=1 Tax=Laetiporus sulphureus 93-53 TaxID=1314785 RepID=A0A165F4G5_9APHY|nr:uncharacterized protein LAESUDRAFT_723873 [Laetiporus sulphureus 93-53]KZT08366.1 hypothetical protein LAESUDRAFT_723873 [Laetiporus sulphureus 93-53]